jgi:hypothetical protein
VSTGSRTTPFCRMLRPTGRPAKTPNSSSSPLRIFGLRVQSYSRPAKSGAEREAGYSKSIAGLFPSSLSPYSYLAKVFHDANVRTPKPLNTRLFIISLLRNTMAHSRALDPGVASPWGSTETEEAAEPDPRSYDYYGAQPCGDHSVYSDGLNNDYENPIDYSGNLSRPSKSAKGIGSRSTPTLSCSC